MIKENKMNKTKPLLLVDGSNLVYRVFYAFHHLFNSEGHFTGGLYGFIKMLNFYCEKFNSNEIIIAWDSRGNWRKDLTKSYKEHRHNKQKDEGYEVRETEEAEGAIQRRK